MSSNYCSSVFLPHVVRYVAAHAPRVRLIIQPINNPIERMFAGEVDLSITADDMSLFSSHSGAEKLHLEQLFSDEFVCVVAKDHPLRPGADLDEILSYPHVGVQMFGTISTIENAWIERHRPGYKPNAVVADWPLVAPMVEHTTFVGSMPCRMAELSARAMQIRTFTPPYAMPRLNEAMMWHSRHMQDPAHVWLRGVVRDVASTWLGNGESPTAVNSGV